MALEGIGQHGNIGNSPWNERKEDKGIKVKGTEQLRTLLCVLLFFAFTFPLFCFRASREGEGESDGGGRRRNACLSPVRAHE